MSDSTMPTTSLFCCERMKQQETRQCDEHPVRLDCVDTVIHRFPDKSGLCHSHRAVLARGEKVAYSKAEARRA